MAVRVASLVALVVAALSLGPSFAHVLEAPPRLSVWTPELWRAATVFNGQFAWFAVIGAPVDLGAVAAAGWLAWLLWDRRPAFAFALAGTLLFAAGLAAWFGLVAPANAVLATWTPGPLPADFDDIRLRWEAGHMVVAALKFCALVAVAAAAVTANGRSRLS
jgi:hypothetical protein